MLSLNVVVVVLLLNVVIANVECCRKQFTHMASTDVQEVSLRGINFNK